MPVAQTMVSAKLEARHFNRDGQLIRDYGVISMDAPSHRSEVIRNVLLIMAFAALFPWSHALAFGLLIFGLVTNVGVNYEAAAFSGIGPSVAALNYHDSGTGTNPAAITDTTLQTPAGAPRVLGTQSSATNVYQTIGLISYPSILLITEWGLFSASSGGTLWDRREFGAITTAPGDKIEFTYTCLFAPGGI